MIIFRLRAADPGLALQNKAVTDLVRKKIGIEQFSKIRNSPPKVVYGPHIAWAVIELMHGDLQTSKQITLSRSLYELQLNLGDKIGARDSSIEVYLGRTTIAKNGYVWGELLCILQPGEKLVVSEIHTTEATGRRRPHIFRPRGAPKA